MPKHEGTGGPGDELEALDIAQAGPEDAAEMVAVMHAAFAARGPVDPPPAALAETPATIAEAVRRGGGVLARIGAEPAGVVVLVPAGEGEVTLTRVSVHPRFQHHGIAAQMIAAAHDVAARAGFVRARLLVRREFPELARRWARHGYRIDEQTAEGGIWVRDLPVAVGVPTAEAMTELGRRLASLLRGGDVLIATGDLGAGKTTLVQGIGAGLGVEEEVISPTFVLSRVHRTGPGTPDLVHVDAYRLGSAAEVDDLDLDASLAGSVTVIEWGRGVAEQLADERLELDLLVEPGGGRTVLIDPVGRRWDRAELRELARALAHV
ncbi:tRNA threonylcarbamoyladenosine biosynthesis protein TsaE [Naumannella cuiyingiana]|uniref:tRNA threonylcarbamoyladenosine biosynthesis protein TsaE n=1 Tax=Naumannella cuiyingiana TaxID=1347891 RepID=A0A7Z0D7M7_9ACTN|nr:tRNA threonylcarbamoyladenosine biosynthesis protein TsaE [Naumannella cuiyingiana]